jgi:putative SOS response-associated peptidase YedK
MCGRYTHLLTWRELVEFSRLGEPPGGGVADIEGPPEPAEFKKRYNQAPTEIAPVVRIKNGTPRARPGSRTGRRELVILRWGWGKMKVTPRELINARAEKLGTPPYVEAFRLRRCLIPVSGFYEWRKMPSGRRAPHWIGMKDRSPLGLAGIWKEITNAKTGEPLDAYVIVTCSPNELMERLHDRMPLTIDPADYDRWLSADPQPLDLLKPYPAERMTAYEISTRINKPGYDAPDILDPVPPMADGGGPATPQLPL